MRAAGWLGTWLLGICGMLVAPEVHAQDINWRGDVELRAVQSELDADEGEEIDSSGIGANAGAGASLKVGKTTVLAVEFDLGVFDYSDNTRRTRESYSGSATLTQKLSRNVALELRARRAQNIAVLEALSADQAALGAQVAWESGKDRIRLGAEWRQHQYDTQVPGKGEGVRVEAQYNRRLGPYHWLRIDLRHEDMESKNAPVRSFERQVARLKYSLPMSRQIRLRPSVEWRQWKYDARIAQGDPQGERRRDHYWAPALDLSWGRETRGFYGVASGEYRLRSSNDLRFGSDALRLGLRVGYRF